MPSLFSIRFLVFSDARLMNDWLDAVNVLAVSQGHEPQKHILSHILFGALPDIKAMGIFEQEYLGCHEGEDA